MKPHSSKVKKLGPPDDLKLCLKRQTAIFFSNDLSIRGPYFISI